MSNVREFGAIGDGRTDDADAISHAIGEGDGVLVFPRGVYRIGRTIEIRLDDSGPIGIDGSAGTAKVVMSGTGPAFRLVGTHQGTADPKTVKANVWRSQRMPTVKNIEIEGRGPEADGIEMIETMQSVFEGVLIRQVRHGIRLSRRNRNVLISHCHIYNNTGVGVFLDRVNLHQINITGSHISYNRLGGIRVENSQVFNLQITGNDIEYNNHRAHNTKPEPTAEIYIDTTAEGARVDEITVASNTIQATVSPGGANIRIIGAHAQAVNSGRQDHRSPPNIGQKSDNKRGLRASNKDRRPGLWAISGNLIGNQENNVHLTGCHGIVFSGNFICSCDKRNLLIEHCSQINIGTNSFRRHESGHRTGIRLIDSADCVLLGCTVQDESLKGQKSKASLLELEDCRRITVSGCQFLDGVPYGIDVNRGSYINISGCTIMDTRETKRTQGAIRFRGSGHGNLLAANTIGEDVVKPLQIGDAAGVKLSGNIVTVDERLAEKGK